jgi:cytoskeletal protein CcmA (bactofilin family)
MAVAKPLMPPTPTLVAPVLVRTGEVGDPGIVRRAAVQAARWTVRGTTKVTGSVDVDTATIDGTASIGAKLSAAELRVHGTLEVGGDATVSHVLRLDGSAHLGGTLHAGDLDVKGAARIGGALDVDRAVLWRGSLEVGGTLKASRLAGEGKLDVGDAVTAKEVDLILDASSRVRSITAETVRVRVKHRPLKDPPYLDVERIDADIVDLEGVHLEYLRASQISAGADCRIARFDGKVVRQHATARLGPSSISDRPHGLWR